MIDGVLSIAKPRGLTSHDVVACVRRAVGQRRVGHAGTLDPRAEGVLVVLLGRATRLSEYVMGGSKLYRFSVVFGIETDTLDLDGAVVREAPVDGVTAEALAAACRSLVGSPLMAPPAYSAIKQEGRKLYQLARAGQPVDVATRATRINSLALERVWSEGGRPMAEFVIECESGTYVRSVGREIASTCGTVGSVDRLVRERSGTFHLAEAAPLDAVLDCARGGRIGEVLLDMRSAVASLPTHTASQEQALGLLHGNVAHMAETGLPGGEPIAVLAEDGSLIAIAECRLTEQGGALRPLKVLVTPPEYGSSA